MICLRSAFFIIVRLTNSFRHMEVPNMSSQERELFDPLFSTHNRREFMKRAGAIGLSGAALSAFLEACGGTGGGGATPTPSVNMAGPIDLPSLMVHDKTEGKIQAIGIPPSWADYADILAGYTKNYSIPVEYQVEANYSSAQELEVFKNSKSHPHGDIGYVGFKFRPVSVQPPLPPPHQPSTSYH